MKKKRITFPQMWRLLAEGWAYNAEEKIGRPYRVTIENGTVLVNGKPSSKKRVFMDHLDARLAKGYKYT